MELATIEDVSNIMGGSPDAARAQALIVLASGLVAERMGYTSAPDIIPWTVRTITATSVVRAFTSPVGLSSQQAGPFSTSFDKDEGQAGVYLTEAEVAALDRLKTGVRGLFTIQTYRGDQFAFDRYTPVSGSDKPLPIES